MPVTINVIRKSQYTADVTVEREISVKELEGKYSFADAHEHVEEFYGFDIPEENKKIIKQKIK